MTMTATDLWSEVYDERRALLELLETLPPADWDAPSLCAGWRVRDVVGHLVSSTDVSLTRMLAAMVTSGFNINRYIRKDGIRRGSTPVAELLPAYRESLPSRSMPPRLTVEEALEDIVLHQIDIRRPLGRPRPVPEHRLRAAVATVLKHRMYVGQRLVSALQFRATDCDWSTGTGPVVSGPLEAITLVLSGRPAGVDALTGPGLEALQRRLRGRGQDARRAP